LLHQQEYQCHSGIDTTIGPFNHLKVCLKYKVNGLLTMMNKERKQWRRWKKAYNIVRSSETGGSTLYVPDDDIWWHNLKRMDETYLKIRRF
jgi:hypothetical protein